MQGPDQYDMDDQLMDELGGAMDDFDSKKFTPVVQITVSVGDGGKKEPDGDEGAMPTPEEMEELEKALG
jgi:hypothetical protein